MCGIRAGACTHTHTHTHTVDRPRPRNPRCQNQQRRGGPLRHQTHTPSPLPSAPLSHSYDSSGRAVCRGNSIGAALTCSFTDEYLAQISWPPILAARKRSSYLCSRQMHGPRMYAARTCSRPSTQRDLDESGSASARAASDS